MAQRFRRFADRAVQRKRRRETTKRKALVIFLRALTAQHTGCKAVFREQHEAAGANVQAAHRMKGAGFSLRLQMGEHGASQRAALAAPPRKHCHARRLVDNK